MKWIAFFSQTGSEIVNIINKTGLKPALIVTNNSDESKWKYHPGIRTCGSVLLTSNHDTLMNYFRNQTIYHTEETFITLHGYLRILPPDICSKYTIFNGHPALINTYPELRGKDPQERIWQNNSNYATIGSVVHKVIPAVDEGEILEHTAVSNNCKSLDDVYSTLKETSLTCWINFLKKAIYENRISGLTIGR